MKKIIALSLIVGLFFIACNREIPNPIINPDIPDVPSTPTSLQAKVADRELLLTWTVGDTAGIAQYRVYKADSLFGEYTLYDSTETASYTATNFINGYIYFYKITDVDADGIEGQMSGVIYATPNLFSVIINDGLEQTNDRYVTLTMIAPSGTSLMKISNSADFTQSPWETYASSKTWLLTAENREKTVYAMFRRQRGRYP